MLKKITAVILASVLLAVPTSCQKPPANEYSRFEYTFMDLFDTYSIILGYAKTEAEFSTYSSMIYERLKALHREYDIYSDYDGINNLKTINDNAGIKSVKVSRDIIELLNFGKQAYADTDGRVNIAMGSVLKIWHDYRSAGIDDPESAALPPAKALRAAAALTDIDDVIINEAESTVFLAKRGMRLDVGAVAKGFAARLAVGEAREAGMYSALVNLGGNILSVGRPLDGVRDRWGVGIQNPELQTGNTQNILDTVFVNDAAVVTSGNYQRYYEVGGKIYSHIIDKDTLFPADRYKAVTVVCEDSAAADMLSTALYILSVADGRTLLGELGGEAIWIHHDNTLEATDGYVEISKVLGGYGAVG